MTLPLVVRSGPELPEGVLSAFGTFYRRRLATPDPMPRRLLSGKLGALQLTEQGRRSVTITRTGSFHDPRYGKFEITRTLLAEMVKNFEARTYGQDIHIDVAHRPSDGSAGTIVRLWVDGDRLMAEVEWTPYGRQAITERGYQYLSADYAENWIDNERRQAHGAVLFGAALTIRPVIKRLDPIQLSEPTGLHTALAVTLTHEVQATMNKHLEALRKRLAALKLADKVIGQLGDAFTNAAKNLGEDDKALSELVDQFVATGKTLAEAFGDQPATINLSIQTPQPTPPANAAKALTEADVQRLLAEDRAKAAETARNLTETTATLKAQFRTAIDAAEGLKALSEQERGVLLAAETLIHPGMTPEQVKALADNQIAIGDQMVIQRQLTQLGWQGRRGVGSTRIQLGADHAPKRLQESIDKALHESLPYGNGVLRLTEDAKLKPGVKRILAMFDQVNAAALDAEARRLADGGPTTISSISVPAGFQRTVIREALSDLAILDIVQMGTDPNAQATTQIPYETRLPGTVLNDGIVYEGEEIPRASNEQRMDEARINAMKISMKISNEVMHFSSASFIDWDAYGRNVESNARLMRELVCRRIANELQRSADAYGATAVTGESLTSLLDGSESLIKTMYWPLVRPMQYRDLQGNTVGSELNPIAISINGSAISRWDGSGTQSAGTYWTVESYNLGYIRLVDEAGDPVTPTYSSGTTTIGYSYATNAVKFDLKLPASTALEDHLNGALRTIGAQKAMLSARRFIAADFQLMSPTLNDTLTNARQFTMSDSRAGSGLTSVGDLATIKGIPAFGTNAPGIDLGDERIIMGQRATLHYVVSKPFMTGQPFEAVGPNGLPTGQKVAYGEEYNAMHVPSAIRNRLTSIVMYDSDARTAAA